MKKYNWINIDDKEPPACREVTVLLSDGTICQSHCIKQKKKIWGWVHDMFTPSAPDAKVLMWIKPAPKKRIARVKKDNNFTPEGQLSFYGEAQCQQ